jgi:hypothetical protein
VDRSRLPAIRGLNSIGRLARRARRTVRGIAAGLSSVPVWLPPVVSEAFSEPAETLTGSADLDLSVAPPTGLSLQPVALAKIGARLQLAIGLSLQRLPSHVARAQGAP